MGFGLVDAQKAGNDSKLGIVLATLDHFLLCTDGLSDMVKANDIKRCLGKPDKKKLVKEANRNGGKDNVSVVMIRLMRDVH